MPLAANGSTGVYQAIVVEPASTATGLHALTWDIGRIGLRFKSVKTMAVVVLDRDHAVAVESDGEAHGIDLPCCLQHAMFVDMVKL